MISKLTLTIDNDVIMNAKKYASANQRSLSDLVENYLKSLTTMKKASARDNFSPAITALRGSFKAPKDFDYDYKKILQEEIIKKHG
jgi:hypothetical protein